MYFEIDKDGRRPMRRFMRTLPKLTMTNEKQLDLKAADPALLVILADDACATASMILRGIGAIGHLLSHSAVAIEDSTIGADSIESLGFFIAEISDLSADAMILSTLCRREIADYQPGEPPSTL
jgi:hypothetical protein